MPQTQMTYRKDPLAEKEGRPSKVSATNRQAQGTTMRVRKPGKTAPEAEQEVTHTGPSTATDRRTFTASDRKMLRATHKMLQDLTDAFLEDE